MCQRYANLERKLGEVDRARAIYMHGSQEVDPRTNEGFWSTWHDFEVAHGNEDTFREMLRVKRSVKAHFSQAAPAPSPLTLTLTLTLTITRTLTLALTLTLNPNP